MRSIRTFLYKYQLSLREKVIAYLVDWCPGRKATLTTSERPAYLVRYQGKNHLGT